MCWHLKNIRRELGKNKCKKVKVNKQKFNRYSFAQKEAESD